MTDITELAQSLRRRAASANEFGEGLFFIKADDVLALLEALEKEQQRIAELESRTVKLPQRLQPGADGYDDWYVHSDDDGEYLKVDDVLAMLTAAGIKVEAE
ncbi:TPA: hypothetical protein ACGUD8_004910 [Klebsiella pneumoniae]|uniref:hypothetical protein n=1 Tax=Klebsiella pneumoniae complex TaxID=3390273 RepID=UPI000B407096|nr:MULTISPECIES: hypothetical protein [Klebsiella]HBZ7807373.1 hypothetical protein [Klebsiella variicola subsp. variicola]EIV7911190.1 hypothetical protein [Klebsiella pneumoniae]EIW8656441.1 hypothetical protein [Klebsiella pneumoniae]EKV5873746.1 hypothetical protein [Klebsiella pneumoniae]EKZ9596944.1 hypothetical protein [Klebsiella pneumoniae]